MGSDAKGIQFVNDGPPGFISENLWFPKFQRNFEGSFPIVIYFSAFERKVLQDIPWVSWRCLGWSQKDYNLLD